MGLRLVVATRTGIVVAEEAAGWSTSEALAGEDVRAFAVDPAVPGRLFAGTQGNGVFSSLDRGSSWRHAGLAGEIVKALGVDRNGRVLAGTKPPALFVSDDHGAGWTELPALRRMRRWYWWQPAEKPHAPYVTAVAVSPSQPGTILVGVEAQRILRSEDGGASWTRLRRGTALDCHALAFHPLAGDRCYEGAGLGTAESSDRGRSWTRTTKGLDRRYVMTLAVDPADPDRWYVGAAPMAKAHTRDSHAYVYRSQGGMWTRLGDELQELPHALACPEPNVVYAGLRDGTVLSTDRGDRWERLPLSLQGLRALLVV